LAEEEMKKNLIEEVRSAAAEQVERFNIEAWIHSLLNGDIVLMTDDVFAMVNPAADMSWQQCQKANDSLSGHAIMFGCFTRKPIWYWCIKQKGCWTCTYHSDSEDGILAHECTINHDGLSKSMEPFVGLEH
jgi:hypothetical protein